MQTTKTYPSGGKPIPVEIFDPPGTPNGGVVILAHGSGGMAAPWDAMIRAYATAIAARGFVTAVPFYFGQAAPPVDVLQQIARWQTTLADAIPFVKALPHMHAGRVALVGFSLGGNLSLRLRASAKVVVEYFAPDFQLGGIGHVSPAVPFAQIHHGEADSLVLIQNAKTIEKTLRREGTVPDVHYYPKAGHGFSGKDPGDAVALRESQKRTVDFLVAHL